MKRCILVLLGVNTVDVNDNQRWVKIYQAHSDVFDVNGRTNVAIKDAYKTLVGQGYAVNDKDWQEGEDCFTEMTRDEFGLVQDQKDCALL